MDYKSMALEILDHKFVSTLKNRLEWRHEVIRLLRTTKKDIYIFGAGEVGLHFYHVLQMEGVHFCAFLDNDASKWGNFIVDGLKCVSPESLENNKANAIVIIGAGMASYQVFQQLQKIQIKDILDATDFLLNFTFDDLKTIDLPNILYKVSNAFDFFSDEESKQVIYERLEGFCDFEKGFGRQRYFFDIYREQQYFLPDIMNFSIEDVLVDCGAYTGDTLEYFLSLHKPFKKYIAYELSGKNYQALQKNIQNICRDKILDINAYNVGVGIQNEKVFYSDDTSASAISRHHCNEGYLVNMTEHLVHDPVSFIKMDIEGAEMNALRGAAGVIQKRHPKLAICIYHKISDLWEIPLYIKSLVPDYQIYIRQHTPLYLETVCYACK